MLGGRWQAILARGLISLVAAMGAIVAPVLPASAVTPQPTTQAWLDWLNYYRATAAEPAVTEDASLSAGDYDHARYTVINNVLGHSEDSNLPGYTAAGNAAAGESDVLAGEYSSRPSQASSITDWATAPFHMLGELNPFLLQAGYGDYWDPSQPQGRFNFGAALDILGDTGPTPQATFPIKWPGNGEEINLTSYSGNEWPDPQASCPGATGLPILLQVGTFVTVSVSSWSLTSGGTSVPACEFDYNTYQNSNSSDRQYVQAILKEYGAVVIMPERPLATNQTYTVNVTANGQAISWSFGVGQPPTAVNPPPRPYTGGSDAVGVANPMSNAYFAEGFTGVNDSMSFQEYLTVENPSGSSEMVDVDYLMKTGTVLTRVYTIAARSRYTIDVNHEVGPFAEVSAHVYCDSVNPGCGFVAERPMYFYYPGIGDGGDDVMGTSQLGTTFYFAEGYTGPGFHEFLTLMNPGSTTANVTVTYLLNGGVTKAAAHQVSATSRSTVDVNQDVGCGCEVGMRVDSDQPILAERPMYFDFHGRTGGHVVAGVQSTSTTFNLAEGFVSPDFDEFLTFLNPGGLAAQVTIYYLTEGDGTVQKRITVPASSRFTETVSNDLLAYTPTAVHITSDQPLVVERPMYFDFSGRTGGHDAVAVPDSALSRTLFFAEGFVATGAFDEYYTLLNSQSTSANVTITLYLASGPPVTIPVQVGAGSRATVHVNDHLGNLNANSALITSDVPILAERPMYFAY